MSTEGFDAAEGLSILRFRPTAGDMVAASDLVWRDLFRRIAVIGAALLVIISVIGQGGDVTAIAAGVILAALFFVLLWTGGLRRAVLRRLMGRRYASMAGEDEVVVALTPRGIRSQWGASTTLTGWADVTGILEDERTIVLLKGRTPRLLVPKRAFPTASALAAFHAALAERVGAQPLAGSS